MNEFQASLGILQLKYIDEAIEKRKLLTERYYELLKETEGITIMHYNKVLEYNFAYFPILINSAIFGRTRDEVYDEFKRYDIHCRRYFYPLINQFPTYQGLESSQPGRMPIAERVTKEILCLPIYPDLEVCSVELIAGIINKLRR